MSFRREKYVRFGGPDGGDGGAGGGVIIVSSANVADLSLLARKKRFAGGGGQRGAGRRKNGKKGAALVISVPVGTMVFTKAKSGEEVILADLRAHGEKVLVARGGGGGLGNARFATAVNQSPEIASKGKKGEERHIVLELRLITDIAIVGQPNAGKSTLLSAITRARPQISSYPFTTLQPVLGVLPGDRRDFIVVEIPGIVEGSHLGKGLGNAFLHHAERTKLLIYLLDGSSPTLLGDFKTLDKEIAFYNALSQKPKILAVNRVDLPEVQARLPQIEECLGQTLSGLGVAVFYISAITGQGVLELIRKAMEMVEQAGLAEQGNSHAQVAIFRPKPKRLER